MGPDADSPTPPPVTAARPGPWARARRILAITVATLLAALVATIGLALFGLGRLEHPWIKPTVVRLLGEALALELDYRKLSISVLDGRVHGEGLVIAQPARFRGKAAPFVALREADVRLAVRPLLSGEVRISEAELAGLALTYVADETTDSVSLLFPTDPSEPVLPLSRSLESLRGLGVDVTRIRAPGASVAYVGLESGRVVDRMRLAGLAIDGRFHERAGRLDVGFALAADEPARGATLEVHAAARPASADGSTPAREAIRGEARLGVEGALGIRRDLELRLGARLLSSQGLPVPAGRPLATSLELALRFDEAARRTRIVLRRLSFLDDVLVATLDGTVEDAQDDTLRGATGRATLAFDEAPWLPEGLEARGVRGTLVLDQAELSPRGVLGRLDLRASAERAGASAGGRTLGADGLSLTLATHAELPLDQAATAAAGSTAAASDPRLTRLRVELRARSLSVAEPATGSSVEGSELAATLTGPGLVLAPTGPTSVGPADGAPPEADVLDVSLGRLSLAEGRTTSAVLETPRLRAEGIGLVGALANDRPADGRVSLEASELEARSGADRANLAPVSVAMDLHAFLKSAQGLFGLGGRADVRLATAGTVASGTQVARLSGFAPTLVADFDRGTVEGQLPIGSLAVREGGEETLSVAGAELRFATSSPTTLAPPSARGRLQIEGRVGRASASGSTMSLPRVRLALDGEGGAYAIQGEADVRDLETTSGRFEGEHRLSLGGRADLRTHVVDLESRLAPAAAGGEGPRFEAQLHASVDRASGSLENRMTFSAERIAPEMARFLPEGTQADVTGIRVEGGGSLAGLFARPPRPGEIPALSPRWLSTLRGEERVAVTLEALSLAQRDGASLATPRVSLVARFVQRDEGAVLELDGEAGPTRIVDGPDELVLHGFRPHVEIRMPDADTPEVASIAADVRLARVEQDLLPGYPVSDVRLVASIDSDPASVTIRELVLSNEGGHGTIRLTGAYESDVDGAVTNQAARSEAAIDGRQALSLRGSVEQDLGPLSGGGFASRASGRVRIPFEVQSGDLRSYRGIARIVAEAVSFANPEGTLTVEGLNGEIPIEESVTLLADGPVLDPGAGVAPMSRARFPDVQPFLNTDAFVTSERIVWQGSTLGPLAGNVRIAGTTVRIDRLQVGYRGGELTGQLEADLMPGASHLSFRGNATGIRTERGGEDVLDANLALRFVPSTLALDGSMHLVRMSRGHLLELIDALDPYHEDPDMNTVRSLLRFGYPRFARLVASEGLVDFEISLGGLAGAVRIDAIRAIPIAPLLDEYAAPIVDALFPRERPRVAAPAGSAPSPTRNP